MSRKLVIIIAVGFIVGVIMGGGIAGYLSVRHYAKQKKILDYQFECQPEISTSLVSMHALESLRANETTNTNTVEYLETQLDYAVAGIGRYLEHHPLSEHDSDFPAIMPTLRSAKRYRVQFPHPIQDVILQRDLERAFSVVDEKSKP